MTRSLKFTKMHGAGNCYIYIDGWKHSLIEEKLPELAIAVSNISTGIGADGLIVMAPSAIADVKMRMFNKDGSEGKNCGNGLRCIAKYIYENGLSTSSIIAIETLSGIKYATVHACEGANATVAINMGIPQLSREKIPMAGVAGQMVMQEPFEINGQHLHVNAVSMGNPHAIFFVPSLDGDPHRILGPAIEKDNRFPEGVNVEFVSIESPTSLHCRVWERGSGVTLACGTGACAVAVSAILNGYCSRNEEVTVNLEGGSLAIRWLPEGQVIMRGTAQSIAEGIIINGEAFLQQS